MTIVAVLALILVAGVGYSNWYLWRAHQQFPPLGKFVEVADGRLHFLEKGTGPAVVLIHGASGSLRDYALSIFDDLSQDHRVVAIDRPGHGYSDRLRENAHSPAVQAELIHKALQRLNIDQAVIVGHSWGGAVALAYALQFPSATRGIVAMAPASHPWRGDPSFQNRLATTPIVGDVALHGLLVPIGQFLIKPGIARNFAPNPPLDNYIAEGGVQLLLRPSNFRANAEDVINLQSFLLEQKKRYPEIQMPLTILTGTADGTVSPRIHANKLHKQVPHSRLINLEETGHMPHHARKDDVLAAIRSVTMADADQDGFSELAAK